MDLKTQNELAKEYVESEMNCFHIKMFTLEQRRFLEIMLLESFNDGYAKGHNRGRLSGALLVQGEVTKVFNDIDSALKKFNKGVGLE